jgi:hypothetical protein
MLIIGVIVTFGATPFTLLDPGLDVITVSIIFFPIEAFPVHVFLSFVMGRIWLNHLSRSSSSRFSAISI